MLATIEKKSLLIALATCSCSAIISLASLTADADAGTVSFTFQDSGTAQAAHTATSSSAVQTSGDCLFTVQLATDPALKAAFSKQIRAIRDGLQEEINDDAVIYETDIEAGIASSTTFADSSTGIDKLSHDCLSCHDGVMAKSFDVRIKNNPNGRAMSLIDIIGGHPVGMDYENYVSVNGKKYRGEVRFSNKMVFAEGKVGCLTCHNPLNSSKGHLVMNNDRSELCFSCHNT
jgi:predicted CXXCH cytochrome family protein